MIVPLAGSSTHRSCALALAHKHSCKRIMYCHVQFKIRSVPTKIARSYQRNSSIAYTDVYIYIGMAIAIAA